MVSATPDWWRPRLRPPAPAKISNDRKGWPIFGRAPSSLVDSSLGEVSSSLEDFFPFPEKKNKIHCIALSYMYLADLIFKAEMHNKQD